MQEALDCEKWREYGDLLYAYGQNIPKGTPSATLTTFDQSGQVKIDLDVRFDGRGNAKKCFQKYNKGKKGQEHLLEQIDLCEKEIEYFEGLEQQLELANFEDALSLIHISRNDSFNTSILASLRPICLKYFSADPYVFRKWSNVRIMLDFGDPKTASGSLIPIFFSIAS